MDIWRVFCAPFSSHSPRKSKKRSLLARLSLAGLLVLWLGLPILSGEDQADEKTSPPAVGEDASSQQPPLSKVQAKPLEKAANGNGEHKITKLIPDQKAILNSSDTVIDLSEVFAKEEVAQGGGPLNIEVKDNKKEKVAKATIEGHILRLDWGQVGKSEIRIRVTNEQTGEYLDNKFLVSVWEPDYLKLVLTVIGGLGIFLLGMKNLSDGLQAVAGNGLRKMIGAVTDNRLMATGVGTLVTTLVQSSSITTVMVVGFVNSGFMNLTQAIGVIMGANIGTTITGWIIALKIGKYGLPILGLGAFAYLFSKRDRLRYTAMAFMGLGMVFLGLELMKDGFSMVKDLPEFEAWFHTFEAGTYVGVLKCAMVGCILTFIVQSSSATLGITIALASIGVIEFDTAAALVLGENIGTTITAWLASFGATTNARRAAYFHVMFNLIGVAWIIAIFFSYLPFIKWFMITFPGIDVVENPTAGIAAVHTGFNVANTILFLPFVVFFAKLLQRFVPEKAHKEKPHLTSLDIRMLETPIIATEQSRVEVMRMGEGCNKMMEWLKTILESDVPDDQLSQKTFHREEVLDTIQDEITAFLSNMLAGNVPHDVIDVARRQLRMADEFESVSDYIVVNLKSHLKLLHAGQRIPEQYREKLNLLHDEVADYLRMIYQGYERRQPEVITKAHSQGETLTHHIKDLRDQFLAQMSHERIEPQVSAAFNAQLNAYRRVRDHALNIAEALAGEK